MDNISTTTDRIASSQPSKKSGRISIKDLLLFDPDSPHPAEAPAPAPIKIKHLPENSSDSFVNKKRINDARHINKMFESANQKLEEGDRFICFFESKEQRKKHVFEKYPLLIAYLYYYLFDFPWNRVFPKVKGLQKIYFGLTKGHNRALSTSEVLGRVSSCGFKIDDYREIENQTYIYAEKIGPPECDENPTYGPFITLNRVGGEGEMIQVYKFRTMHPYAEYLQEFVYEQNKLEEGGKFKDDFRITKWGKTMRKFWIDELPMLFNWLKGDLKLVGVRPLSKHYFSLYPEQLQKRRKEHKPGLVPPFYADLPETLEEIVASEKKYMTAYERQPYLTDIKYFFKAFHNIVIKRARSN